MKVKSESEDTQSCPTLSDPIDCSLPGSSIHGIFQARVLEWGAIAFSDTGGYSGTNWGIHSHGAQHSCSGGDAHAHDPLTVLLTTGEATKNRKNRRGCLWGEEMESFHHSQGA